MPPRISVYRAAALSAKIATGIIQYVSTSLSEIEKATRRLRAIPA